MKHSLGRRIYFTPDYHKEVKALRSLILQNWWYHGCVRYFAFSQKCKTSVGLMANELAEAVCQYKSGELSEEKVTNKFRWILDLLDYYSMQ